MTTEFKQVNTIYCDEAGFTGNDLLSDDQPHFVYSSVVVSHQEAAETVAKVLQDYRLQGSELKGSRLIKSESGRAASTWILEKYAENSSVVIHHKKYSLAAKFFEYIFEPVLSSQGGSGLYYVGFHKFISNLVYLEFITKEEYTEKLLVDFQAAMRAKDFDRLEGLFVSAQTDPKASRFLRYLVTFCTCHRDAIVAEFDTLREVDSVGKWVLDLSTTALNSLLAKWGQRIEGMIVYCDNSKPIADAVDFFDVMINRTDKQYFDFPLSTPQPITYNLAQPIQLVNSKDYPGIQIADVIASLIAYSLKSESRELIQRCLNLDIIHPQSIFPDPDEADISKKQAFVNAFILETLIDRTLKGESLFEGIPDIILYASKQFDKTRGLKQ